MKGKIGIGFGIVVIGIIVIALFLMLFTITRGRAVTEVPAGDQPPITRNPLQVDGMTVYLQADPAKIVQLLPTDVPTQQSLADDSMTPVIIVPTIAPTETPAVVAQATEPPVIIPTNTPTPFLTPAVPPIITENYIVQPGDTLYHLTTIYNTTIELMAHYNIAADNLVVGATIALPIANPAYCPGIVSYIVRGNDTLFSVANSFGTTVAAIQQRNNLGDTDMIRITQVLCIP